MNLGIKVEKIELSEVDYLAKLSRIYLSNDEKKELSSDLSKIIGFVKKIEEIDTEGLEPLYNVIEVHKNFLRKDEIKPSLGQNKIENLTSYFNSGHFVVPKVIE